MEKYGAAGGAGCCEPGGGAGVVARVGARVCACDRSG